MFRKIFGLGRDKVIEQLILNSKGKSVDYTQGVIDALCCFKEVMETAQIIMEENKNE